MSDSLASLRRPVLAVTIGSFSIAALMGVLALVAGGGFGEGEVKILLTTLVVGAASICVLCYLATAETPYVVVGLAGGAVDVMTTLVALSLVWASWDTYEPSDVLLKGFLTGTVLSLSLAQACMLLGLSGRAASVALLLTATLALVGILAVLLTFVILAESHDDAPWRLIGVVGILDVLGTVVTVAIARFGARPLPAAATGPVPGAGELRVSGPLVDRLAARAAAEGRTAEKVLADAVERYLNDPLGSGQRLDKPR